MGESRGGRWRGVEEVRVRCGVGRRGVKRVQVRVEVRRDVVGGDAGGIGHGVLCVRPHECGVAVHRERLVLVDDQGALGVVTAVGAARLKARVERLEAGPRCVRWFWLSDCAAYRGGRGV